MVWSEERKKFFFLFHVWEVMLLPGSWVKHEEERRRRHGRKANERIEHFQRSEVKRSIQICSMVESCVAASPTWSFEKSHASFDVKRRNFLCALKCDVGEMRMGEREERKESVRDDMSWINKKICAECGTAENHFHHTRFMCFCNERESGWMKWAQKKENRASMVVGVRAANRHDEYKW